MLLVGILSLLHVLDLPTVFNVKIVTTNLERTPRLHLPSLDIHRLARSRLIHTSKHRMMLVLRKRDVDAEKRRPECSVSVSVSNSDENRNVANAKS
jgi:hypothetical protein